ncbi:DUF5126 domain-containing protein [Proteiniphilum propionicum]|jgi:hypothetical protein|uniref:DUF5126 domain-containing protein n=1 Tax=Proteiniphilum propionicum TaxID=2829812 RepID=UPI001EECE0E1|nr:DUF5126 domain-containing protein [Proteiniphilum propionicum]ULB35473.1 DUF5126 domain-containing protein [Proteiniphilum propionicum]
MKKILLILTVCLLIACEQNEQIKVKPAQLTDYKVSPINGGATITYTLPPESDILYVVAEYKRDGEIFTERSSFYNNSITIEGFNVTTPIDAILYTVNREEMKSDPIQIVFEPLESPLSLAFKTLDVSTGFGGIVVSWENLNSTELGVRLMVKENDEIKNKDMFFSSFEKENHTFRGFESEETTFAVSIEDKWGNVSDTIFYTTTPFFETEVPKPFGDMRQTIPFDITTQNPTFNWPRLFNNIVGDDSWLTTTPTAANPQLCAFTIDLKQVYKLSRMTIWPRMRPNNHNDVYAVNNVLSFEMWGTTEIDPARLSDRAYWLDEHQDWNTFNPGLEIPDYTFKDDWVYLGYYEVERLDLKGATPTDIMNRALQGEPLDIPIDVGPVRYIRFFPRSTDKGSPTPGAIFQIAELSFFGDNTVNQE